MPTRFWVPGLMAGAAVLFLLMSSLFVVRQTEQALVLQFGAPVKVHKTPGLKFKLPLVQNVIVYDNRLIDFDASTPREVITTDNKRLIVSSFVRYRIVNPLQFYQAVKNEENMRTRLNSILESSLGQVIGKVPMSVLLSAERTTIMKRIRDLMNAQAHGKTDGKGLENSGFGIEIVDVRIKRIDLPSQNSEAIYKRMQTDRVKEAKQIRANGEEESIKIRARADKERTILLANAQEEAEKTRGEGDGEAARISSEAFGKDPTFYDFYRRMQSYRKTLDPQNTQVILSPDNEFLKGISNP